MRIRQRDAEWLNLMLERKAKIQREIERIERDMAEWKRLSEEYKDDASGDPGTDQNKP